jgi:hypothetical protein
MAWLAACGSPLDVEQRADGGTASVPTVPPSVAPSVPGVASADSSVTVPLPSAPPASALPAVAVDAAPVPAVTGLAEEEAQAVLGAIGFTMQTSVVEVAANAPEVGSVVAQDPAAGDQAALSAPVRVSVARAPGSTPSSTVAFVAAEPSTSVPPVAPSVAAPASPAPPVADRDDYDFVWAGGVVNLDVGNGDVVGAGGSIQFLAVSTPTYGRVTGQRLCGNVLCLVYQPDHNGEFRDSFTYTVVDALTGLTSTASVHLTVRCNPDVGVCHTG